MIQVDLLWLINEDKQLLLARRADHKVQDPGLWGPSVTGKLESNETFEQALAREAHEELGLKADSYKPKFLFETDFMHPDGEIRRFKIYMATISKETIDKLVVDANEVAEIRWWSVAEAKKLLKTKPGEMVVASAFVLWSQIFAAVQE